MLQEKNIIFSLDDFGINQKANANTLKLIRSGKIDRVSVMAHGSINASEVDALLSSGVKIDVHVDLKNKVDPHHKLKDSAIKRSFIFILDYFSGKIAPTFIEKQWDEQIQRFQELFHKNPDGISSHEHVHFFPSYFGIILRLSKKYDINYIRFGKESYIKETNSIARILNWLRKKDLRLFLESNISSSDIMLSFDWINNFESFLKECPKNKEMEIIFHPERDEEMTFLENICKNSNDSEN